MAQSGPGPITTTSAAVEAPAAEADVVLEGGNLGDNITQADGYEQSTPAFHEQLTPKRRLHSTPPGTASALCAAWQAALIATTPAETIRNRQFTFRWTHARPVPAGSGTPQNQYTDLIHLRLGEPDLGCALEHGEFASRWWSKIRCAYRRRREKGPQRPYWS